MTLRHIVADLHNHSTASDGEYSPSELVVKTRTAGLQAVGLTDHDSISGLDEAIKTGQRTGMTVVPGVEVSLRFNRPFFVGTLHVLLYFPDALLHDAGFRDDLINTVGKGRGTALVKERIASINRVFGPDGQEPLLKRPLTLQQVASLGDNITRRHFFLALSKYHSVKDKSLTDRIIGNSSPAYIPSGIDMSLLHPFLQRYPVIAVLAHPAAGSFPGDSHYKEVLPSIEIVEQLLPEFLDPDILGIDGLEVYYPGHTRNLVETLLGWAHRHDLLITGGSDCHDGTHRPPGSAGMTQQELDVFLKKIADL